VTDKSKVRIPEGEALVKQEVDTKMNSTHDAISILKGHQAKMEQAAKLIDSEYPNKDEEEGHQAKMQSLVSQIRSEYKKSGCTKCAIGKCADHAMDKALTSRKLAIPMYLRAEMSQDNILRSATTQTSRMFTALAPGAAQTVDMAGLDGDYRSRQNASLEDVKRSQQIEQQRIQQRQVTPRTSRYSHL